MTEVEITKSLSYAKAKQLMVRITLKTGQDHEGRPMDISTGSVRGFSCYLDVGGKEIEIPIETILNVT